jgi:hypothetical protein
LRRFLSSGIATGSQISQGFLQNFQPEEPLNLIWLLDQPGLEMGYGEFFQPAVRSKFRGPPGEGEGILVYLSMAYHD